jgi:hypothetical protein
VIDVDLSELNAWGRVLARAGFEITVVREEKLTEAAIKLQADAKANAPVLTGDLRKSIYRRGGKEWRRVGSPLKQGYFQEFGTSRHGPQPWLFSNGDRAGILLEREMGNAGARVLLK